METVFTIFQKKPPAPLVTLEKILGPAAAVTDEQYARNEQEIDQIRPQQQLCKNCQGISCEQQIEGMVPMFTSFRGHYSLPPPIGITMRKSGI